jgi:hypothetical protein
VLVRSGKHVLRLNLEDVWVSSKKLEASMGILGLRFLRTARKTGKNGGRPKAITMQKRSIAKELYDTGHPIMIFAGH